MPLKSPHVRTRKIVEPSRLAGIGRGLNAHRMVAETAVQMAEAAYEQYMTAYNDLYKAFRVNLTEKQARRVFVMKIAPTLLEEARLALTDCLAQPGDVCSQRLKEEIVDALIKDVDFRANRSVAAANVRPVSELMH